MTTTLIYAVVYDDDDGRPVVKLFDDLMNALVYADSVAPGRNPRVYKEVSRS
jgi:hypothetical protein